MIDTGMYLPLRMYQTIPALRQDTLFKVECKYMSHQEYFWCLSGQMLPFQCPWFAGSFHLYNICDETTIPISISLDHVTSSSGHVLLVYKGGAISETVPDGLYVLRSTPQFVYSDPIMIGSRANILDEGYRHIHLKYRNPIIKSLEDITTWGSENIYWHEGFFGECYINSNIEKPTYPILEEQREDQEGNQHRVFQRWDKRHQIRFFGVESMADAMSLLPTMDEVYINGTRVYNTTVNITWEEDRECLAEIVITFTVKELVKVF